MAVEHVVSWEWLAAWFKNGGHELATGIGHAIDAHEWKNSRVTVLWSNGNLTTKPGDYKVSLVEKVSI